MEKIGILFSGGLESTSLIYKFLQESFKVELIYVKFGFKWEDAEIIYAKKIANFFDLNLNVIEVKSNLVFDLGFVNNVKSNIIILRNLSLIINAANFCVNKNIYNLSMGLLGDNRYPDTSLRYISNIEMLISEGINKKFNIFLPFYGLKKKDIFCKYKDNIPLDLIFSCTNPIGENRCGKCYKCKQLNSVLNSKC